MRTFIFYLFFIACKSLHAQDQIKRAIYNDLFELNKIYDGCILQSNQSTMVLEDTATIWRIVPLDSIKNDFNRVSIISIEVDGSFYHVKVKFNVLPGPGYINLFDDNDFNYVLYKYQNYYYAVNGFLVSEILLLGQYELLRNIGKHSRLSKSPRFAYFLKKRRIDKLRNYLKISIIEGMNKWGCEFNQKPYVKDTLTH